MKIQLLALTMLFTGTTSLSSAQKNITKSNLLFGPVFKTAHVTQERAIGSRFGLVTTVKARPAKIISPSLQNLLNHTNTDYNNPFTTTKMSAFGNVTEFRIYGKDKSMRGFYFGPFTSAMFYKLESDPYACTFTDDNDIEYTGDLKQSVKFNVIGGGLEMGVQGLIKDKICIDWTILGLGFAIAKLSGGIEATNTSANFDLRDYDIPNIAFGLERFIPIKKDIQEKSLEVSVRVPWPIIRTTLNVGFAYGGAPSMPKEKE